MGKTIAGELVKAAKGDWGRMERTEVVEAEPARRQVRVVLRSALEVIVPLAVVVVLLVPQVPLGDARAYLLLIASAWAINNIGILIDRRWDKNVAATKTLSDLIGKPFSPNPNRSSGTVQQAADTSG
jgi:hypothetical protein